MSLQLTFRKNIIRRTLLWMGAHSPSAELLLFGTAMHESEGLLYARQVKGPALGPYQMEPAALTDLWTNWLAYREDKAQWLKSSSMLTGMGPAMQDDPRDPINLLSPVYATVAARLHYMRDSEPLPLPDDITGLARYYKRVWNTGQGKATEQDFIDKLGKYGRDR